jgi:hypothetical protein
VVPNGEIDPPADASYFACAEMLRAAVGERSNRKLTKSAGCPTARALAQHPGLYLPAAAIRAAKRLLNLSVDANTAAILRAESDEQQVLLASAGHADEALAAGRGKRASNFED